MESGIKNADLWSTPCVCCAHAPVRPSAEINSTLPRQFFVSVSSIVTPVVFGHSSGLIPSRRGAQKPLSPREMRPFAS
jgi:hypothetical protein